MRELFEIFFVSLVSFKKNWKEWRTITKQTWISYTWFLAQISEVLIQTSSSWNPGSKTFPAFKSEPFWLVFFKMGKLNVNMLRYLTKDEFRILVAVEMGMKNHELVPKSLVVSIAQVRSGVAKLLRDLCKNRRVLSTIL